jgi:hypothetical protein
MPAIVALAFMLLAASGFYVFWVFVVNHHLLPIIWQWWPW